MDWSSWLQSTLQAAPAGNGQTAVSGYQKIAVTVLDYASMQPADTLVDVGTGTGLLAFAAASRVGNAGRIVGVDREIGCLRHCRQFADDQRRANVQFVLGDARALPIAAGCVDVAVCRSVLCHIVDKRSVLGEWHRVLRGGGRFSFFEPVDRHDTLFSDLVDFRPLGDVAARLRQAEQAMRHDPAYSLMNFDEDGLQRILRDLGFQDVRHRLVERSREHAMSAASAMGWWHKDIGGISLPGHPAPYEILRHYLPAEELDACVDFFCRQVDGKTIVFRSRQLYMWGRK